MPPLGAQPSQGAPQHHQWFHTSAQHTHNNSLRFNSLISFLSLKSSCEASCVGLQGQKKNKKWGEKKVKHNHRKFHNKQNQKTLTTNYVPPGKTQSAAYTTSLFAPLFIGQLKHLFLHRTTQHAGEGNSGNPPGRGNSMEILLEEVTPR